MMNAIETGEASAPPPRSRVVPVALIGLTAAIVLAGTALLMRAEARTNKVALASAPRPVSARPRSRGARAALHSRTSLRTPGK